MISIMTDHLTFCKQHKYLVLEEESPPVLYTSLRELATELGVDHSTISKRLRDKNYTQFQLEESNPIVMKLPWGGASPHDAVE